MNKRVWKKYKRLFYAAAQHISKALKKAISEFEGEWYLHFVHMWKKWNKTKGSFSNYVYGFVVHRVRVLDWYYHTIGRRESMSEKAYYDSFKRGKERVKFRPADQLESSFRFNENFDIWDKVRAATNEREQTILRLRFVERYTQVEVGKKLGFTKQHIQRIEKDALHKIRLWMTTRKPVLSA